MKPFFAKSTVQQLAAHLREEILAGRLQGDMPGVNQLVRKLGMGTQTVVAAIATLEKDGLLESRAGRRGRRIVPPTGQDASKCLKVGILLYEPCDVREGFLVDLRHHLQDTGHIGFFSSKSLVDLEMDPKKVARHVAGSHADAWVVLAGSQQVLEWFANQPFPSFAFLGRNRQVDMASVAVSKTDAVSSIIRQLTMLGHRNIVLMTRDERRKPQPGALERHFLSELESKGIPTGTYNLPDWDNDPKSYHERLDSLFSHTPPTAVLFDEPVLYHGAQQFFMQKGLRIPNDVSVAILDSHPSFRWHAPMPCHIETHWEQWIRAVMRWIRLVSRGKVNRRKALVQAELVEGETIGPIPLNTNQAG